MQIVVIDTLCVWFVVFASLLAFVSFPRHCRALVGLDSSNHQSVDFHVASRMTSFYHFSLGSKQKHHTRRQSKKIKTTTHTHSCWQNRGASNVQTPRPKRTRHLFGDCIQHPNSKNTNCSNNNKTNIFVIPKFISQNE